MASNPLKSIPSVHELLESPQLKGLVDKISHNVVVHEVRTFLENLRSDVRDAADEIHLPTPSELAENIAKWIVQDQQPKLKPVINGTGILLHTGLGRAPLADVALQHVVALCSGYASVEVDLESGERSNRIQSVAKLLCELTGAEAAAVTNNNAGATILALGALAPNRAVVVSRGQLVEIGGSYRLPEIMEVSGSRLREVGTTNKTRITDYAAAIGPDTGALLRVHTSNYVIRGFTEEASLAELVALARQHQIPLIDDIGSGALIDFQKYGIEHEPMVKQSLRQGADLVLFSGDKLLGGPQCGIVVGKKDLIAKITRHPLMRAMRVDKMTLAALGATLQLYRDEATAEQSIPLLMMLSASADNLKQRASRLAPQLGALPHIATAEVEPSDAYLGGGSVPTQRLASWSITLRPTHGSVDSLAKQLRTAKIPIFPRVQQDRVWLDMRSILPKQDIPMVQTIQSLGGEA